VLPVEKGKDWESITTIELHECRGVEAFQKCRVRKGEAEEMR
jgi:hypothetical protein